MRHLILFTALAMLIMTACSSGGGGSDSSDKPFGHDDPGIATAPHLIIGSWDLASFSGTIDGEPYSNASFASWSGNIRFFEDHSYLQSVILEGRTLDFVGTWSVASTGRLELSAPFGYSAITVMTDIDRLSIETTGTTYGSEVVELQHWVRYSTDPMAGISSDS